MNDTKHEETFETQLRKLLNTWSREASSNTPDFVLCQFMARSLEAFDGAVNARDRWYGFKPFDANAPTNAPRAALEGGAMTTANSRQSAVMAPEAQKSPETPRGPGWVDTKAIRARADAATAGPWGVWEDRPEIWSGVLENEPGRISAKKGHGPIAGFVSDEDDIDPAAERFASDQAMSNAEFCAAARTDVPALCDRVEALEAALRYVRLTVPPKAHGTLAYIDAVLEGREP